MNLKKALLKILYDENDIELTSAEEAKAEALLTDYCNGTLNEVDTQKINALIQEDEALEQAIANLNYSKENYMEAIAHFEMHFKDSPERPIEAFLCYGISLYRQTSPNYDQAIEVFNKILEGNNYFSNAARWHLAMLYLKSDEPVLAKAVLKELLPLTEAQSERRKDVEAVLNVLN